MADTKISALTALTTPDPVDYVPIVDVSAMTTKRTLVAGLAPVFNVKNYGAKGDNSTNDYSAIAAAMAAASAAGGGTLYFPAGIYVSSSTLTLSNNINVMGEGGLDPATDATFKGSWLKGVFIHGSYNYICDIKLGDGVSSCTSGSSGTAVFTTFERVRFRGGGSGATYIIGPSSSTGTCNDITWKSCIFEANGAVNGDTISVLVPSIAANRTCNNMHFYDCIFSAYNGSWSGARGFDIEIVSHYGSDTTVTVTTSGWVFEGCTFETNTYTSGVLWGGISLSAQLGASDTPMFVNGRFSNCHFKGNPRYGIAFENGSRGWTVDSCVFWHHGGGPIQMWGKSAGGHTITGNVFDSITSNGLTATTAYMLTLRDPYGCTISGNTFWPGSQNTDAVIQLEKNDSRPDWGGQNVISGNLFHDMRPTSGAPFIRFAGGRNNLVTGNYFHTRRADGVVIQSTDSSSTGNVITGNYFDNGTGGGPFYTSAGSMVHYNNYYSSGTETGILDPVFQATAAPSTMETEGAMYYNTTDHKLYVRTNAGWVVVGAQS